MKASKDILNYGWFMKFGAISLKVMVVVALHFNLVLLRGKMSTH
jgi:hypothetical protein